MQGSGALGLFCQLSLAACICLTQGRCHRREGVPAGENMCPQAALLKLKKVPFRAGEQTF